MVDYFTDDPATRGQRQQIAELACELLDLEPPTSRLAASAAIIRLRRALEERPAPRKPPEKF